MSLVQVPAVSDMSDEILIKHMHARHGQDVSAGYRLDKEEPDRKARGLPPTLRGGVAWRRYHDYMHSLYDGRTDGAAGMYDHIHKKAEAEVENV